MVKPLLDEAEITVSSPFFAILDHVDQDDVGGKDFVPRLLISTRKRRTRNLQLHRTDFGIADNPPSTSFALLRTALCRSARSEGSRVLADRVTFPDFKAALSTISDLAAGLRRREP